MTRVRIDFSEPPSGVLRSKTSEVEISNKVRKIMMKQLNIEFDDEDQTIINTRYIIESDIDIYADEDGGITERRHLNNLYAYFTRNINDYSNKDKYSFKDKRQRIKKRFKARLNDYQVGWNVKYNEGEEDLFRCHADSDNNVNVYYVHSFTAFEVSKYIEAIKACVELFDDNSNPIIVINDLNNGGAVVLAQIFLGVLSPLMPINKFKGRFRITDSFILIYCLFINPFIRNNCEIRNQ